MDDLGRTEDETDSEYIQRIASRLSDYQKRAGAVEWRLIRLQGQLAAADYLRQVERRRGFFRRLFGQ